MWDKVFSMLVPFARALPGAAAEPTGTDRLVLRIRDRDSALIPLEDDQLKVDGDPLPLTVTAVRDRARKVTGLELECGCDGFRTLRLVRIP